MRILLVGDPLDLSAAYMRWLAERRGMEVLVLSEDRMGLDWWFRIDTPDAHLQTPGRAELHVKGDRVVSATEIDGALVRLHPDPGVSPDLGVPEPARDVYVQERRAALQFFLSSLSCPVINRPMAGRANGSKPFQMADLARAGFSVPAWIAANDAQAARAFAADCAHGAVFKSASGLRSHVRRVDDSVLQALDGGTAPLVLQALVPGKEVRIHTVGGATFATRVHSDRLDYRFDGADVDFTVEQAPADLSTRCCTYAKTNGLLLGGFDFRVDADGCWWCLEMNPVPTFLPYEAGAGHPIGEAILNLLVPASSQRHELSLLAARLKTPVELEAVDWRPHSTQVLR